MARALLPLPTNTAAAVSSAAWATRPSATSRSIGVLQQIVRDTQQRDHAARLAGERDGLGQPLGEARWICQRQFQGLAAEQTQGRLQHLADRVVMWHVPALVARPRDE